VRPVRDREETGSRSGEDNEENEEEERGRNLKVVNLYLESLESFFIIVFLFLLRERR
jgi:hypothetical protein